LENKIIRVSYNDYLLLKDAQFSKDSVFLAEIEGKRIKTLQDYLSTVNRILEFPIPTHGLDGYQDWIRDLSWLNSEEYVIVIKDFKFFLSGDSRARTLILESFENTVLPWWQSEIEQFQVEGKAKPFNVYLVD